MDEILGTLSQKERINLVKTLIEYPLSQGNSVVLTCRTHVFETLGDAKALVSAFDTSDHRVNDRTADVVDQLLQGLEWNRDARRDEARVILLQGLSDRNLDDFMLQTDRSEEWEYTKLVPGVVDLARRPVLLYLIGKITDSLGNQRSKEMGADQNISVSGIYELAIKTWIRRDSACCKLGEEDVFDLLEAKAMEFWNGAFRLPWLFRIQTPFSRYMNQWRNTIERSKDVIPMLERAGLIMSDTSNDKIPFLHYSFLEFFLARAVAIQVCSLDASILAMLNLVAMYTVNQFLVEHILYRRVVGASGNHGNLPRKLIGQTWVMNRPVNAGEFSAFVESSGWREGGILWGASHSRAGRAGVKPLQGMGIEDFEWGVPGYVSGGPVSNISWYDACVFAKYFGGRLCSIEEIKGVGNSLDGTAWEWTREWRDHGRSLMAVQARDGRIGGANPDVRDSCIGFRVAWDQI